MRVAEIEASTPAEIALYLDDDLETKRPPSGGKAMTFAEQAEYLQRLRTMTPRERLEAARRREI